MPLVTIHLLALASGASVTDCVQALKSSVTPLVIARAVRWIIKPEKLSSIRLLNTQWDLLVILPLNCPIPSELLGFDSISDHWSITAGVPSRVINGFEERNQRLLHPHRGDVPALTGALEKPRKASSSQGLELSDELARWAQTFRLGQDGAVSMLNLLSFKPAKEAHESYKVYGQAFAQSIGSRRGGNAKIVGKVVPDQNTPDEDKHGWDEIALAHYPSIRHFVDMLASEDYQKVNHESRLPALRDTCILCTTELDPVLTTDKSRL